MLVNKLQFQWQIAIVWTVAKVADKYWIRMENICNVVNALIEDFDANWTKLMLWFDQFRMDILLFFSFFLSLWRLKLDTLMEHCWKWNELWNRMNCSNDFRSVIRFLICDVCRFLQVDWWMWKLFSEIVDVIKLPLTIMSMYIPIPMSLYFDVETLWITHNLQITY